MLQGCAPWVVKEFGYLEAAGQEKMHYLDSAASSLRPRSVIDGVADFERRIYANVHRGAYHRSERSTAIYEMVRQKAASFLGARASAEIIFTSGFTAAANLVAYGLRPHVRPGDEIVLGVSEHHSNLLPWQRLAAEVGAVLRYIEWDSEQHRLCARSAREVIGPRTRLLVLGHVSNVSGAVHPVAEWVGWAKEVGAWTFLDGAQAVPHLEVDVQAIGCDFYAFTGHKMLAPSGVGVLYGRGDALAQLEPWQVGGGMVHRVGREQSEYALPPARFEAGTPPISPVAGLGMALDLWQYGDREQLQAGEVALARELVAVLQSIKGMRLFCPKELSRDWVGIVSFFHPNLHPHDVASLMDQDGVCVRAGMHCAELLHGALGVPATLRVSFFIYNDDSDVVAVARSLRRCQTVLT